MPIILPDSYNFKLSCGNCGTPITLSILKGTAVATYIKDHDCSNCGCKLIGQGEERPKNTPVIYAPYYGLRR